jgi:Protein of unknown function (DUF1572)
MSANCEGCDATIKACLLELRKHKALADKALAQIDDAALFHRLNDQQNSIAVIMRHMAGNMISRWTDFRTTDGEKPNRNRDEEFADRRVSRSELTQIWETGWATTFAAIESIRPDELNHTLTIRGEPHTYVLAIVRQATHYAYHVGQILLLAKHFRGEGWKYLTVAPGKSQDYNRAMQAKNNA